MPLFPPMDFARIEKRTTETEICKYVENILFVLMVPPPRFSKLPETSAIHSTRSLLL
jgi:hypothetical protein